MNYDTHKRNIIGTLGFFCLGVLIGGFASAIAVWREWLQYKENGVLESNDVMRYVIAASIGAIVQLAIVLVLLL